MIGTIVGKIKPAPHILCFPEERRLRELFDQFTIFIDLTIFIDQKSSFAARRSARLISVHPDQRQERNLPRRNPKSHIATLPPASAPFLGDRVGFTSELEQTQPP